MLRLLHYPVLQIYRKFYFIIARLLCHAARKELAAEAKDLLFVRNDCLGDFVCSLPLLDALSRHVHRRGGRVVIVVSPQQGGLARRCGIFDAVLELSIRQGHSLRCYRGTRKLLRGGMAEYRFREAVLGIMRPMTGNDLLMSAAPAAERIRIAGYYDDDCVDMAKPHAPYTRFYRYRHGASIQQNDLSFYEFITGEKPQLRPYAEYMPRLTAA